MNYAKHYSLLLSSRQLLCELRTFDKQQGGYYEKHHILPRCYGGTNSKSNLVMLTAREHYIAHWLLWKIYKDKQMAYAFYCMSSLKQKRKLTSKQYDRLRKMRMSAYSGANSPRGFLGKTHTEEAKAGMRKAKIGRNNPMYDLGDKHPNCKRRGKNNPNYGKEPWLNPSVIRNPKQTFLWQYRDLLYGMWQQQKQPSWYKFGSSFTLRHPSGTLYTPYDVRNIVKWFERNK